MTFIPNGKTLAAATDKTIALWDLNFREASQRTVCRGPAVRFDEMIEFSPGDSAMPLRDHFRLPFIKPHSWEGFHGCWPTYIIQYLNRSLPEGYIAEPRVHLGTYFEIDVGAFENDRPPSSRRFEDDGGGVATLTWAPVQPGFTLETDLSEPSEYEVLIYDLNRARRLVAAVELVSPANKDRPEHRRAFVAKCAAMLQQQVCVAIVDLVTIRQFNLYADLLDLIGRADPALGTEPSPIYAVSCRSRKAGRRPLLDTWMNPLIVGRPLPTLPLWLTEDLAIPLELETSYEETCRNLRIE